VLCQAWSFIAKSLIRKKALALGHRDFPILAEELSCTQFLLHHMYEAQDGMHMLFMPWDALQVAAANVYRNKFNHTVAMN
jgi:hypothetical protein